MPARFPYSAINFHAYETTSSALRAYYSEHSRSISDSGGFTGTANSGAEATIRFVSGALAGGVATVVCYPLDLVRTRLTTQVRMPVATLSSLSLSSLPSVLSLPPPPASSFPSPPPLYLAQTRYFHPKHPPRRPQFLQPKPLSYPELRLFAHTLITTQSFCQGGGHPGALPRHRPRATADRG